MVRVFQRALSALFLLALSSVAHAEAITYNFSGSFRDGTGTFAGSFVYDNVSQIVTSGTLSLTDGVGSDGVTPFSATTTSFVGQQATGRLGFSNASPVQGNRGQRVLFSPDLATGAPAFFQIIDGSCTNATCTTMSTINNTLRSTASATLTQVPAVASLAPSSGSVAGGSIVTITGSGFTNAAAVTFGGIAANTVTFVSASEITAVSPAHGALGAVDVIVTTSGGTSSNTAADDFTYFAAPVATAVPTMSEWAMILLGLMLAGGAVLYLQRRQIEV